MATVVVMLAVGSYLMKKYNAKKDSAGLPIVKEYQIQVSRMNNKYTINGRIRKKLKVKSGRTYQFKFDDETYEKYPLYFSQTDQQPEDYHHNHPFEKYHLMSEMDGDQIKRITSLVVKIDEDTPERLYYHCANHPGMGGMIQVVKEK